jgi:pyruvate dehydrogenase E1 component beta subunit
MPELTYLEAIRQAQIEEMRRDGDVLVMGQDMRASLYGATGLLGMFGAERVIDLPTSETAAVGTGVGAAMTGLRPVVDMTFACFTFVAMDQFVSQVAKARYVSGGALRLPVTYRMLFIYDAGVGVQHSDRPHPMFMSIPGIKIVAPTTPADAKGLLKSAIRDDDPVIVFEHKALYGMTGELRDDGPGIGRAEVVRAGDDVTVVATQLMRRRAEEAAERLAADGISCEVIDPRTVAPLDTDTILQSLGRTGRIVCVQEAPAPGSWGQMVLSTVAVQAFELLDAAPQLVTADPIPIPYAKTLEDATLPSTDRIEAAVRSVMAG